MPRTPRIAGKPADVVAGGSDSTRSNTGSSQGTPRRRSPRGLPSASDVTPPILPPAGVKRGSRGSIGGGSKAPKRGGNGSPSASAAAILRTAGEEPDDGLEPVDAKGLVVSPVDATVAAAAVADADDAAAAGADAAAGPAASARGIKEEEGEEGSGGLESGRQPKGVNSRREAFAKVARSRGAHFARPDQKPAAGTGGMAASGGGGGSGSGRGPGNARGRGRAVRVGDGRVEGEAAPELWPGPFAEARRLMDKREEAAALRESVRVHGKAQAGSDDDSDPEGERTPPPIKVEWTPRGRGSRSGKSNAIPSLFQHCLNLLSDNFDHIESLGDVSPVVRNHLAGVLCRQLKLTTEALARLSEPGVSELVLPDCSRIEPDQMLASLLQCRGTLRVLRLGTCGRCIGDATLKALAESKGLPRLETAALAGTYQLTDAGVLGLLSCCPKLTGLEIPANSRITRKSLDRMVDAERPVGSALTSLSLTDCIHLGPDELGVLAGMSCLERLSLSGLTKLTDKTLREALEACGKSLRHLDVSDCTALTDASLRSIGERCGVLESLSLGMCPLFSTGVIRQLFQYDGSSADATFEARSNGRGTGAAAAALRGVAGSGRGKGKSEGKGKGKGKGKGTVNGKGKGKARATFEGNGSAALYKDGEGEEEEEYEEENEEEVDEGEEEEEEQETVGVEEEKGGKTGGVVEDCGAGHAMLKSRLTSVSLRGLAQVDDATVTAMAAACSDSLRSVDLKGVALITDASLVALARYCSNSLQSVDLSFCRATTDDGLGHLVDASQKLRSLGLWGCTQVGDRFLRGHSREELVISRY